MSVILIIAGIVMLFMGFYTSPVGEIHDSILIAYGEVSTFSGALLGIDYTYKYKVFKRETKTEEKIDEEE